MAVPLAWHELDDRGPAAIDLLAAFDRADPWPPFDPIAVPVSEAVLRRLAGFVFNPITCGISGAIGWTFGGLLPGATGKNGQD